jgi:hypothetical protein
MAAEPVNPASQFTTKISDRLLLGSAPFPYDVTTENTWFRDVPPLIAARTWLTLPSFNDMSVRFTMTLAAGEKLHLDKSFIRLRLLLCDVSTGAPAIATVNIGCPWNPLCVMSSAEYSLSNGTVINKINENLDWSTTIMRLLDTSREVMNHSPERFITPCIEDRLDLANAFSTQTPLRSMTFVDTTAVAREFMIPLSDLFGELAYPVDWTCNRLDCTFTFKNPLDPSIVFKNNAGVALVPALVVEDCQLCMNVAQLTPTGEAIEMSRLKPSSTLLRVASVYADVKPFAYGPSAYTDNLITNCIGAALIMPIPPVAAPGNNATPVNPMQSRLNVTGIQMKLGGFIQQPDTQLIIDGGNRLLNTRLHMMYTQLCRRLASSDSHYITPALASTDIQTNPPTILNGGVVNPDLSPYGIVFMGFFDDTADLHKTQDGALLEVIPTGGIARAGARVARIRNRYVTITGDYRVTVLE